MATRLRIEQTPTKLVVQRRGVGPARLFMLVSLAGVYWAPRLLRTIDMLVTALADRDWGAVSYGGTILLIVLCGVALIFYSAFTSQSLRVDTKYFQMATKVMFQPIRRSSYPTSSIRDLRYGIIRQSQTEVVRGLVFEVVGNKYSVFENLGAIEADDVLNSCEAFGIHTLRDPGVNMMRDIKKRGWLVNPWRPDPVEEHPKEQ